MSTEEVTIVGQVVAVFYENPQNFYKVVLVGIESSTDDRFEDEVVVTGIFGQLHQDTTYEFTGIPTTHPKYGLQLKISRYQQKTPMGDSALISYFSSDEFVGVGEKIATKIVDALEGDDFTILFDEPERLKGIKGFSNKKQKDFIAQLKANRGVDNVIIALNRYGFSQTLSQKIWQKWQTDAIKRVETDPYDLIYEIEGVGLKRCDVIAQQLDFEPNDDRRLMAGLYDVTQSYCYQSGNTRIPIKMVIDKTQSLLESSWRYMIQLEELADAMGTAGHTGKLIVIEDEVSIPNLYFAELGVANSLKKRLKEPDIFSTDDRAEWEETLASVELTEQLTYDSHQEKVIIRALQKPVFLVTGGPGTGKTTIINGIAKTYAAYHDISLPSKTELFDDCDIKLVAPTGRAAKRMQESTNLPATTIHRLLGLGIGEGDRAAFISEKLDAKLVIVDEMSMVDVWLMNWLLQALPTSCQLVLVGDQDQLPSVGPGKVFADLLSDGDIPQVALTKIYRQDNGSTIIPLAHDVKNGIVTEALFKNEVDRSFIPCSAYQVPTVVTQIMGKILNHGYTFQDVQVLAPMYRGIAGITHLNTVLQELNQKILKHRRSVKYFDSAFWVGDKVLQLVNNPELGIYNGDIGEITAIDLADTTESKQDELTVLFDQTEVVLRRTDWQSLTLAYCCSIHKAQGSEFELVILPLVGAFKRMLQRHLLYTAITRSKQKLIMVGERNAFEEAVMTIGTERRTFLRDLLGVEEPDTFLSEHQDLLTNDKPEVNGSNKGQESDRTSDGQESHDAHRLVDTENKGSSVTGAQSTVSVGVETQNMGPLTEEMIRSNTVDPMIGVLKQPSDFMTQEG